MENPTRETIATFKAILCERFPSRAVEIAPIPFNVELSEQKEEESLSSYYQRVATMMQRIGVRDRPSIDGAAPYSMVEEA
ncbi:hypothetical protein MMC12_007310, partial [Toensbergia leucococca]|nr:hypothetical protein [Toensbergia leucococca]